MTFAVFDTFVLLSAFKKVDPYVKALGTLDARCDKIAISKPIRKEFSNKLHSTGLTSVLFQKKLSEIARKGKIVKVKKTKLTEAKQKIQNNRLPLPNDKDDHKFIEVAIAAHARYIVTTDHSLLSLNPYRYNNSLIEIITPDDYVQRNSE
jgi:putative PIN family toxin of toxin-antitoxin system